MVADGTGNVYIAGCAEGELYGAPSSGGVDIVLLKLFDDMSVPSPTQYPSQQPSLAPNGGQDTTSDSVETYDKVALAVALPLSLCAVMLIGYLIYIHRRGTLTSSGGSGSKATGSRAAVEVEAAKVVSPMYV